MIELRNLLLAVDFSDSCLKATEYAVALANRFGAGLCTSCTSSKIRSFPPDVRELPASLAKNSKRMLRTASKTGFRGREHRGGQIGIAFAARGIPHRNHRLRAGQSD